MPTRRIVKPPEPLKPVELLVEMSGLGPVKLYGCPRCGRNGQDRKQIEAHIQLHGGEE